jgi:hypothetical protein
MDTSVSNEEQSMSNTFTAVFEQTSDGWIGSVEELPGANTQGATLDEARQPERGYRAYPGGQP